MDRAGIELPAGRKVNLFRANSTPRTTYAAISVNARDSEMSADDLLMASEAEIAELGPLMRDMFSKILAVQSTRMIKFDGVRRELVDGHPALVTEYIRTGPKGPVVVQNTVLVVGKKEINLVLSYRQSEADMWKPIVAHMRKSFRVEHE